MSWRPAARGRDVTSRRAWIGFWMLAFIWGSSFLFIRIGVEQLPTFQLGFIRTGIAAVGLNIVVFLRGKRLPTDAAGGPRRTNPPRGKTPPPPAPSPGAGQNNLSGPPPARAGAAPAV